MAVHKGICEARDMAGREDWSLKRRLMDDAEQGKLINFALAGLKQLRISKAFAVPSDSAESIKQMRELTQPVTAFITECCEMMPPGSDEREYYIDIAEMYDTWAVWCKLTGRKPGNISVFGRWMSMACPTVDTVRIAVQGRRRRVYRRIRLASWVAREYFGSVGGK